MLKQHKWRSHKTDLKSSNPTNVAPRVRKTGEKERKMRARATFSHSQEFPRRASE